MLRNWKEKDKIQKIFSVIGIILSIAVIILALLYIIKVIDTEIYMLLLGILMLDESILFYKTSKTTFIIYVLVGLFIVIGYILKVIS